MHIDFLNSSVLHNNLLWVISWYNLSIMLLFQGTKIMPCIQSHVLMSGSIMDEKHNGKLQRAIAMDCEMVGGGSDDSINLCARVCLVDEDENIILHTYVQPQIPVTDYRYHYAPYCIWF